MNARTLTQLRSARQRDLASAEIDIKRTEERLVALRAERTQIIEDLDGLDERIKNEEERNIDENEY